MAKWVHIRGWQINPQNTMAYMSAANSELLDMQVTYGVSATDLDFISTGSAIIMFATYEAPTCAYPALP